MKNLTSNLAEQDIIVHYAQHKWIPYLKNICLFKYYPRFSSKKIDKMRENEFFPGNGEITKVRNTSFL